MPHSTDTGLAELESENGSKNGLIKCINKKIKGERC